MHSRVAANVLCVAGSSLCGYLSSTTIHSFKDQVALLISPLDRLVFFCGIASFAVDHGYPGESVRAVQVGHGLSQALSNDHEQTCYLYFLRGLLRIQPRVMIELQLCAMKFFKSSILQVFHLKKRSEQGLVFFNAAHISRMRDFLLQRTHDVRHEQSLPSHISVDSLWKLEYATF